MRSSEHPRIHTCSSRCLARVTSMFLMTLLGIPASRAAGECTDTSEGIIVDRPDVTNSSVVAPQDSLQVENGLNLTDQRTARVLDGTNTRLRDR